MVNALAETNPNFSKGLIAILAGGVAIGSAAIFMRLAPVAPTAAGFWRMALSVPVLLIAWWLVRHRSPIALDRSAVTAMVAVGLWFAADLFFWHWSVDRTSIANATLLANLASVFTVVVGYFLYGQRFSRVFMSGLMLAIVGAALLVGQNAAFQSEYLFGDMLGLLTAFALTGYLITAGKARTNITALQLMLGSAVFSSLALLPPALWSDGPFVPDSTPGWWPLLGLAVVTHCVGQGLIVYGLAHVPAALGAIGLLIQPIIAAVLGFVVFGEALGAMQMVGGVLILAGIAVSQRRKKPVPMAPEGDLPV